MTEKEILRLKKEAFWRHLQGRKRAKAEGRNFYEDAKTVAAKAQMAHKPYGSLK